MVVPVGDVLLGPLGLLLRKGAAVKGYLSDPDP